MGRPFVIGIIGSLVLVALLGTLTYEYAHHGSRASKTSDTTSTTSRSVQSLCQPTPYKDTCTSSLQAAAGNTTDLKQLIKIGFQVAKQAVQDAIAKSQTVKAAKDDPRSAQALEICREVMVYAMHDLEKTVNSSGDFNNVHNINQLIEDLKVWLGSAATFQQVCFDSFQNATNTTAVKKLRHFFKTSKQLTSNALTMADELKQVISILELPPASPITTNRRLLDLPSPAGVVPLWLTDTKRHILKQPLAAIKVDVVVALDGSGQFKTIKEALATVPDNSVMPFVVYVKEGVYDEQVSVDPSMKNVVLVGDGVTKTVITGNKNFVDGTQTYWTATLAAMGDGFMMRDITVENTAGPKKQQAVAIRVSGDYSVIYRCQFIGYQDTVYALSGRHFYRDCTISGTIDFIFGDALSMFQNCQTIIRKPLDGQHCAVTAQGRTEPRGPGAIILQNCTITAEPDYVAVKNLTPAFLGRPWKAFSRTVIMQSFIDDCVSPAGWSPWAGKFGLDTLFYAEYENRGPGAVEDQRVTWNGIKKLHLDDAVEFTADKFLIGSDWVTSTGAPYDGGFMH